VERWWVFFLLFQCKSSRIFSLTRGTDYWNPDYEHDCGKMKTCTEIEKHQRLTCLDYNYHNFPLGHIVHPILHCARRWILLY
jgi:hypothetical protein